MIRSAAAWLSVGLIAGCGSAPKNRYFILSAVPADLPVAATTSPVAIPQAEVHLPGLLDRAQIVVRTGPQSVDILEFDRWGEPLDQMVSRVLNDDLQSRWAAGAALQAAAQPVSVTISQFIVDQRGTAVLTGHWVAHASGDNESSPEREKAFAFSMPLKAVSGDDIAAVMSGLLGRLADQIERGVTRTTLRVHSRPTDKKPASSALEAD